MDTAWIQVFVLILSECVAPAGKTVCQEQELQFQFAEQAECEAVLGELLSYKGSSEQVIVDTEKSRCMSSARKSRVFDSPDAVSKESDAAGDWLPLPAQKERKPDFIQVAHQERLATLHDCESVAGVTPCKIGEIIIEGATVRKMEVWQQQ